MEAHVHAEPAPEAADGANAEDEESDEQEDDEEESDEQEDDEAESDAHPDGSAPAVRADELAGVVAAGDAEAMLMAGLGDARALFGAPAQPPPQRKVAPSTCPTLAPVDPGTVADDLLSSSSDEDSSSSSSDEGEAEPIHEDEDDDAHLGNGGGAESATSHHRAANGAPRKSTDESTDKSTVETPNEPPPPLDPLVRFSRDEAAQVAGVVSYVVETLVVIKACPSSTPFLPYVAHPFLPYIRN